MQIKFDLKRITLILNNQCNLFCKHCFQSHDKRHSVELTIEDINDALNKLSNELIDKEIELTLIGGEPMFFKNFKKLKDSIKKLEKKCTLKIIRIYTNGTILNQTFIEEFSYWKDIVNFFITKDYDVSTPARIFKNNKSANDLIDEISKVYADNGFKVNYQYVFTKNEVPIFKNILKRIYNKEDLSVYFGYCSSEETELSKPEIDYLIDNLFDFILENNIDIKNKDNLWFFKKAGFELPFRYINFSVSIFNKKTNFLCDPIKGEFSISPKGYVIPCVKILDKEDLFSEYHISNISSLDDLLKDENMLRYINTKDVTEDGFECDKCIAREFCETCRLLPSLINFNGKKHIEHPIEKCNRIYYIQERFLEKYKEVYNLWL